MVSMVMVNMVLASRSEVMSDEKFKVITLLDEITLAVGMKLVDARVVVPVKAKDAEEKLKDMVEGRVRVIYPFALNLEFTLYVIVNLDSLLFYVLLLLIVKSPTGIELEVAVTVILLFTLLESSTGFTCYAVE